MPRPTLSARLQLQLCNPSQAQKRSKSAAEVQQKRQLEQKHQQLSFLQQFTTHLTVPTIMVPAVNCVQYRNDNKTKYCRHHYYSCNSSRKTIQRYHFFKLLSSNYFSGLITALLLMHLIGTVSTVPALSNTVTPLLLLSLSFPGLAVPLFSKFDNNRIRLNYANLMPTFKKRGDSSTNLFNSEILNVEEMQTVPRPLAQKNQRRNAENSASGPVANHHSAASTATFNYDIQPKGCSSLTLDPPTLSFVEEEQPRIILSHNSTPDLGCQRVFECKVLSSPPEANIFWFRNGKIVKATALRDPTMTNAQDSLNSISIAGDGEVAALGDDAATFEPLSPMIGLSQMTHRICLDPFVVPDQRNAFKCKIESVCEPERIIESKEIVVEPFAALRPLLRNLVNKSDNKRNVINNHDNDAETAARPWSVAVAPSPTTTTTTTHMSVKRKRRIRNAAPLITMITSTRMELAGRDVQIACHASGAPKPRIAWSVIDDENEQISYPASSFSFIDEMSNGDLIVESSQTDLASVTLKCEASNTFGTDSDTSTLILLNG